MQNKNIIADYTPELLMFLHWLTTENARVKLGKPDVKVTKTRKLSLSGVTTNIKLGKITDPSW
jgi:hypothetical protein